jgi:hypothetical protein
VNLIAWLTAGNIRSVAVKKRSLRKFYELKPCTVIAWFQNAINTFLCIREKCNQRLKFAGKCIRKFLDFGSLNQDSLSNSVTIWQNNSTLLVQHHEVVNSEILDLAFIAFWNQTLQLLCMLGSSFLPSLRQSIHHGCVMG